MPKKQSRGLKFWLYVEEILDYPSSENKGAGQLCSYCTADLLLCFRIGKYLVYSCFGSYTCGLVMLLNFLQHSLMQHHLTHHECGDWNPLGNNLQKINELFSVDCIWLQIACTKLYFIMSCEVNQSVL